MTTSDRGRGLLLVGLALAIAVLVVHARVVAGGDTWSDVRYHAEIAPPRIAAATAIQHAEIPAWWDGTGFGVPLLGEPSHGAMYPLGWLASTPRLLDLLLIVHLWWAALGVAVWGRRLGGSEAGSLVVGVLVATTGVLASAGLRGALPAIAHLPWVAILASRSPRGVVAGRPVLLGLVIGAIALTGELGVLIDAVVIAVVLGRRAVIPAIACGLAIGCVQWLPALATLGDRAGASVGGLHLARLVELIVPGSFGSRESERAVAAIAGVAPWAPSLYLGAPLLALAAVIPPVRRILGLVIGLSAAALVVGRGGWPAWLGAPEVHIAALAIVLAANAATGFDELVVGERRAIIAVTVAAACTAIAGGALVALRGGHHDVAHAIDRSLVDAGLGLGCIAIALWLALRARGERDTVRVWLIAVFVVAPSAGAVPSISPSTDRAAVEAIPPWVEVAKASPPPRRMFHPVFMEAESEHLADAIATLYGTSAARWGIDAARSDDPARPVAHDQVWLAAANDGGLLLHRFGIAIEILPTGKLESLNLPPLARRGSWSIVPDRPVAPAAAVLRGWQNATVIDDAIELLFSTTPAKPAVPAGTAVIDATGDNHDDRGPPLPCTIDHWDAGDIGVRCTTDAYGYAVVTSTPADGWTAIVDGNDSVWHSADVLRRAVAVDTGTHVIEWHYRAPWLRAGFVVMLVGLVGLAWLRGRSQRSLLGPRTLSKSRHE